MVQTKMAVKTKEEEMMDILAEEIRKEIDDEIMVDMFKMQGWTVVKLPRLNNMMHAVDIDNWCVENAGPGMWNKFGATFMFKESKHAEWFMLRWL